MGIAFDKSWNSRCPLKFQKAHTPVAIFPIALIRNQFYFYFCDDTPKMSHIPPYSREKELLARLNRFFVEEFDLPPKDYAEALNFLSLLNLKSVLSDINNTITLKLSLGLVDWISEKFKLGDATVAELRRSILGSKPNSNGFDVCLGYPIAFVAEVKCNIPINGGNKYGAQQRHGIVTDINALLHGKRKASIAPQNALKILAFLDMPAIRAANEHLLKTDVSLLTKLVFLPPDKTPTDLNYVHGVYIKIASQ